MIFGTIFNLFTFIVLCRASFYDTKRQPTIHYMRAIAIFDILMLYGWNFQHYLSSVYDITVSGYSLPGCKIYLFVSYFTAQSAAWLRVFVCLDRFLSLNYLRKTWFSHSKNVLIVIACVIGVFAICNLHLLIFSCHYTPSGELDINSQLYEIFPLWDYINLGVYNCVPFILMVLFNGGVIYHLIRLRRTSTVQNSQIQHRSLSITSLVTTFLFLIMTMPSGIAFGFFPDVASLTILHLTDASLFTYHVTSFPLYFLTYKKFRLESLAMLGCKANHARVAPMTIGPTQALSAPRLIKLKTTAQVIRQVASRAHPWRRCSLLSCPL